MTVAGKFACLHLPVNTLKEIISSLMKALFECLQIFCVWRKNSPLVVWTCTLISAQLRPDTTETSSVSLSQNKTDVFQLFCLWRDRQSWFQLICSIVWWKDELVHTMWVFERATRRCLTFCQWKQSVYLCEPVYSIFSQIYRWPCTTLMLDKQWSLQLCIQTPELLTRSHLCLVSSVIYLRVRLLINRPNTYFTAVLSRLYGRRECERRRSGTPPSLWPSKSRAVMKHRTDASM